MVKNYTSTKLVRKDFEASDLIVAEEQTVSYGNPTLRFTHRTARVTVILTDYTEGMASVKLTGLSTENGNPAQIIPYDKGNDTYTALVAPQSVATGTAFITCAFTNGKVFVYKMKEATDWQAGEENTYTVSLAAAYPGYTDDGNGNYTVTSAEGLKNIAELVNGGKTDINITLDKNIDLTGKEWTPIGTSSSSYTGTFDGGGHTITGLTVTGSDQYAGLFGYINSGGKVMNVVLEDVQITSDNSSGSVGGVAGNSWGTIENCSVSGSVSGTTFAGGVVGSQWGGSITGCNSSATVKGEAYVGGIAGETNSGASLTACYHAKGNINGPNGTTGGVTGRNSKDSTLGDGIISACYWGSNGQTQGIGYNQGGTDGTTQVTDDDWSDAVAQMNTALQSAGSEWRYELTGALPTLKKQ